MLDSRTFGTQNLYALPDFEVELFSFAVRADIAGNEVTSGAHAEPFRPVLDEAKLRMP